MRSPRTHVFALRLIALLFALTILAVLREGAQAYQAAGLVKTSIDVDRYFTNDLVAQL